MSTDVSDGYEVEVHEEVVKEDGPIPIDRRERVEIVRDHGMEERRRFVEDRGAARYAAYFTITNLVWFLTAVMELTLLARMVLRLIAANPAAPFVALVYGLTDLVLWPFAGMVNNPVTANGMTLEITTLIAMVVYLALAWIFVKVIQLVTTPRPVAANQVRVERHEHL